ncbi:50S ribosomal protein L25 [Candidatus Gracilibacteria bacterium]|nr:50S ribosomal protein L25 [Candidatus Gracilibacteria bacterium]
MFSLEAKIRTEVAKIARVDGVIPAVVYGKDTPSTMLTVGVSDFIKVYRESGKNHVITLNVGKKSYSVLVQEAQRHPVTGVFRHLDFLVVNMKAEVHVQIAINLVGTSPAILEGGQLHQTLEMLDVKCLPADIVDAFDLDISNLQMGHSLHVSDLKVDSKKFHVLSHTEEAIVSIHAPKKHKDDVEETTTAEVGVVTAKAAE